VNAQQARQYQPSDAYEDATQNLEDFGELLESLLREMLAQAGLVTHSIEARVKKRKSATDKLCANSEKYTCLADLDDLLGVRVITYFPDQVDAVAAVVVPEFSTDPEKSVDKRAILDPDRFGYLSMHYVVQLHPSRAKLAEYKRFASITFELQIRSILQHAWAEIQHDLGYKTRQAIPRDLQRRFTRLAGLLEIADCEFQAIRDQLACYEERVSEEIELNPEGVLLDQASMVELINQSAVVGRIDRAIVEAYPGSGIIPRPGNVLKNFAADRVYTFSGLGFTDISSVTAALVENEDDVVKFAGTWIRESKSCKRRSGTPSEAFSSPVIFGSGASLLYLGYVLALGRTAEVDTREAIPELACYLPKNQLKTIAEMHRIYTRDFKD
jgi:ppGpp synthetase/RelA/SpoT-type nucleotidyltranferase